MTNIFAFWLKGWRALPRCCNARSVESQAAIDTYEICPILRFPKKGKVAT